MKNFLLSILGFLIGGLVAFCTIHFEFEFFFNEIIFWLVPTTVPLILAFFTKRYALFICLILGFYVTFFYFLFESLKTANFMWH